LKKTAPRSPSCGRIQPCVKLASARERFFQIAEDYGLLNPHLTLELDWQGRSWRATATAQTCTKWIASYKTSARWYNNARFEHLVANYLAYDASRGQDRKVREFLGEFHGLTSNAVRGRILEELGLARAGLSVLAPGGHLDHGRIAELLAAMKRHSKEVNPRHLGFIGKPHLMQRFRDMGCEIETFKYRPYRGVTNDLPWVVEAAFAWREGAEGRRLITGVNWSPALNCTRKNTPSRPRTGTSSTTPAGT
jgi:hypothetical protein